MGGTLVRPVDDVADLAQSRPAWMNGEPKVCTAPLWVRQAAHACAHPAARLHASCPPPLHTTSKAHTPVSPPAW